MGWVSLTLPQVGEPHPALYPKREGQSWVGYSSFRVASLGSHFFPDFIYFKAFSLLSRLFTLPKAIDCLSVPTRLSSKRCLWLVNCSLLPCLGPFTSTWPEIKIEWMTIQQGSPHSNPGKWWLLRLGYTPITFSSFKNLTHLEYIIPNYSQYFNLGCV